MPIVLGRPLSILKIFAQQLPPSKNEVDGNFDRDSYWFRVRGYIGKTPPGMYDDGLEPSFT